MKFSTKLAALFSALLLVIVAVLGYIGYATETGMLENQVREKLEYQASQLVNEIEWMLFERQADLTVFATDPVISSRASSPEEITKRLKEMQAKYKTYMSLSFFDPQRTRIADTSGKDIGRQQPYAGFWPYLIAGIDSVLMMAESRTLSKAVVLFAAIVKDGNGSPVGVVVSKMPVENLFARAERTGPGHHVPMMELLNKEGLVLYSTYNREGILNKKSEVWEPIRAGISAGAKTGSVRHAHRGEEAITAFAREPGYLDFKGSGWFVVVSTPAKTVFAPLAEQRNKLLVTFSTAGLIFLLCTFLFSRSVTKPLKALGLAAAEIGRGNLDVKVAVESRDEIGRLAEAFNAMTSDVKEGLRKIRTLNEELEAQVRERTEQLLDAQEELVRKEKLSVLGQLSGSLGHELRNPLGVINNAVYYLKTVLPGDDEKVKEYLTIIKSEVDTSGRIISDLLDFSRAKAPQTRPVPLTELMDQSLARCTVPGTVTVTTDIPETLPSVHVDPLQMGQVFQNLIVNAIQAMPEGGSVRVTARRVASRKGQAAREGVQSSLTHDPGSLTLDGDFIEIAVADTGLGIKPEDMAKIFQPLFTTKPRGIGLGLTVSRKNVEAVNGRLTVDSRPGKGTTFTVILPVEEGAIWKTG